MHGNDIRPPRRNIVHPSLPLTPGPRGPLAELDTRRSDTHLTVAARASAGFVPLASVLPLALVGPSLTSARTTGNLVSAPPGRTMPSDDRSGLWLRNAAGGLCVL